MAIKPVSKSTAWATGGSALLLQPTTNQTTWGWSTHNNTLSGIPEKPTLQHQNGWQNNVHLWINYLETKTDELTADDVNVDTRLDALEAADIAMDTRVDALEAAAISLDARLDIAEPEIDALQTLTAVLTDQTVDLWTWDLPQQTVPSACVTSVNANVNDLDIKRTGSAGANTWAGTRLESLYASMLLELFDMFNRGIGLQITDASANVWKIVPRVGQSAYFTHCLLSGGMVSGSGGGTCTFKLKSTGIGVIYDVYRNGVSMANFSTFVTTTTITATTFRAILYGTSQLLRLTNNISDVNLLRKRYIRVVWGMNSSNAILYTDVPGWKATFRTYRVHRMMADFMPTGSDASGSNLCFFVSNHITNTAATQLAQLNFDPNYTDLGANYLEFMPDSSDFCLASNYGSGTAPFSGRNTLGSISDMGTYFATNKFNLDKIVIEEV